MNALIDALQDHWWWLIFAALLGMMEIAMPGVFLIWIALAAAITGLLALAFPVAIPAQILIFALLCLASVWGGRRWYLAHPVPSADSALNDRTARLIGQTVLVVEAIEAGEGRVKVGDSVWSAHGEDAVIGTKVRVVGAEGIVLRVKGIVDQ